MLSGQTSRFGLLHCCTNRDESEWNEVRKPKSMVHFISFFFSLISLNSTKATHFIHFHQSISFFFTWPAFLQNPFCVYVISEMRYDSRACYSVCCSDLFECEYQLCVNIHVRNCLHQIGKHSFSHLPRPGGLFIRSAAAVTAVSWNPFSSVLATVDRAKSCIIWSGA